MRSCWSGDRRAAHQQLAAVVIVALAALSGQGRKAEKPE